MATELPSDGKKIRIYAIIGSIALLVFVGYLSWAPWSETISTLTADEFSWRKNMVPVVTILLTVSSGGVLCVCLFVVLPLLDRLKEFIAVEDDATELDRSNNRYNIHLVFLGSLLAVLGLSIALGMAGLIQTGKLGVPFDAPVRLSEAPPDTSTKDLYDVMGQVGWILAISVLMAVLGAVFFIAYSLFTKASDRRELFSNSYFWAGFWFRVGQSIVYVQVFFLIGCITRNSFIGLVPMLPALSLLIGMFVKSGEALISGIAERVFAMVKGLVPPATPPGTPPGTPQALMATKQNGDIVFTWREPATPGRVSAYTLYRCLLDGGSVKEQKELATVRHDEREIRIASDPAIAGQADVRFFIVARDGDVKSERSNLVPPPA